MVGSLMWVVGRVEEVLAYTAYQVLHSTPTTVHTPV